MTSRTTDPTSRRAALKVFGAAGLGAVLVPKLSTVAAAATAAVPEETAGPYPGDGSNGPNVLTQSGVVRRDIRSSFGSASGVAEGVPVTLDITLVDAATSAPLSGAALYLWHCDAAGNYSMYSQAAAAENYLRGVQVADGNGQVSFVTIFPGCYSGRWPHFHFEVYPDVAGITSAANKIATSQFALPEDASTAVYATSGYEGSAQNLSRVSLASDGIFSDGYSTQLLTLEGSPEAGYTASVIVGIATDGSNTGTGEQPTGPGGGTPPGGMPPGAPGGGADFTDIAGDTHQAGIEALADQGIVGGYPDGTFRPGSPVSRGQVATILAAALRLPTPTGSSPFTDIAGDTHEQGIRRVAAAGVVTGFGDGTFRPGQNVSRGQAATMVANGFALPAATGGTAPYSDIAGTTHEAGIRRITTAGLAGGNADGTFRPDQPLTRGQLCTIVARALGRI